MGARLNTGEALFSNRSVCGWGRALLVGGTEGEGRSGLYCIFFKIFHKVPMKIRFRSG